MTKIALGLTALAFALAAPLAAQASADDYAQNFSKYSSKDCVSDTNLPCKTPNAVHQVVRHSSTNATDDDIVGHGGSFGNTFSGAPTAP